MTNRDLLMMLDGDLGERAVRNCMELNGIEINDIDPIEYLAKTDRKTPSYALHGAFVWDDSPEKHYFWNTIHNELQSIGL
jgi:hypothetical protein